MPASALKWKPGRGKLGRFKPLLGTWKTETPSPRGPLYVTRQFAPALRGSHVRLLVLWTSAGFVYEEDCLFAPDPTTGLRFYSFTSDGKSSQGWLSSAPDIHPDAITFEADMPAGRARQSYWPDAEAGFHWAVESQRQTGWHRFAQHHYLPC
jgi:hypothetical protein